MKIVFVDKVIYDAKAGMPEAGVLYISKPSGFEIELDEKSELIWKTPK